jgi:hypothetical protein
VSKNPANIQAFRDAYRAEEIGEHYNGVAHLLFTATASVLIIAAAISQLQQVQPLEWLTIPLTFVYANLAEYFGHRGPMHHPTRGLGLIYRRHTKQHHRFFTDHCMAFDSSRDFKAVLFPPSLIVFFVLVFSAPVMILLAWLLSGNVAWLYLAVALAYFLNYELLHFAYHSADDSWIRRIPGIDRLRQLHLHHHDPRLMQHCNFNISYPIGDWLFGSYHGSEK